MAKTDRRRGNMPSPTFKVGEIVTNLTRKDPRWTKWELISLLDILVLIYLHPLLRLEGSHLTLRQLKTAPAQRKAFFRIGGKEVLLADFFQCPTEHWPDKTGIVTEIDTHSGAASVLYREGENFLHLQEVVPVFAKQLIKTWDDLQATGEVYQKLTKYKIWEDLNAERQRIEAVHNAPHCIVIDCLGYRIWPRLAQGLAGLLYPMTLGSERDFQAATEDWQTFQRRYQDWSQNQALPPEEQAVLASLHRSIQEARNDLPRTGERGRQCDCTRCRTLALYCRCDFGTLIHSSVPIPNDSHDERGA